MSLLPGMRIGKYELGKKLGEGGFGFVFGGRDLNLDREVALKFLHAEHTSNPEILRRFLQEARSAAKIMHPGIVTVFECGQVTGTNTNVDGMAYIAMEFLNGESLGDRLMRRRRLPPEASMEIARQIASALESAHRAGIIHRDLKPDNIFLVMDPAMPDGERVKVLDFGIAKLAQVQQSDVKTQSHMVFGTPRYMSPEQCRSAAHIDHRSDIYTLGCILYELVTGAAPFDGEMGELFAKHQLVAPSPARSLEPAIPPMLDALIMQMLSKAPSERPQTMVAVQRALEAIDAVAAEVAPTSFPEAAESPPGIPPIRAIDEARAHPLGQLAHVKVGAAVPTTLGGSTTSRQVEPRSSRKWVAMVVGALTLIVASIGVRRSVRNAGEEQSERIAAPIPVPVAQPAPPKPTPPTDIELELTSTPKAEVYLVADGRLVGETPYKTWRPPAEGKLVFVLKAAGYQDERVVMPADKSERRMVTLTEIPKLPPRRQSLAPSPCANIKCGHGFDCRDGKCVPGRID